MSRRSITVESLVEINPDSVETLIGVKDSIPTLVTMSQRLPSFIAFLSKVATVRSVKPQDLGINFEKTKSLSFFWMSERCDFRKTKENSQLSQLSSIFLSFSPFGIEYCKKFKENFSGEFIEFVPLSGPREIVGRRFIEYIDFETELSKQFDSKLDITKCLFNTVRIINRSNIRVIDSSEDF